MKRKGIIKKKKNDGDGGTNLDVDFEQVLIFRTSLLTRFEATRRRFLERSDTTNKARTIKATIIFVRESLKRKE